MYIIAVASQKGGSGKTTLAGHHRGSGRAARAPGRSALIDTDPQGSLSEWWNVRAGRDAVLRPHRVGAPCARISRRLRALGMRLLIVDTPPAIAATIAEVIASADLVVIPARPSPHDLRAAGATVELVERLASRWSSSSTAQRRAPVSPTKRRSRCRSTARSRPRSSISAPVSRRA